ncbi:hypothetical protein BH20VER3_BH20VER3_22960 [soil metagenome]
MRVLSGLVKLFPCIASALALFLSTTEILAEDPAPVGNATSLAAAETAFARESVEKGMRSAFLNALSAEGIVFEGGPQNGKKYWQAQQEAEGVLQWEPVLAAGLNHG